MKRILIATVSLLFAHSAWAQSTCGAALTGPFPAAQASKMCSEFAAASGTNATGWRVDGTTLEGWTAGSERVKIDASGNVGVGTTAPAHLLDVIGQGQFRGQLYLTDSAGADILRVTEIGARDVRLDAFNGTDFNGTVRMGGGVVSLESGTSAMTQRLSVKATGQINFVPLAADPTPAAAGDVYYNSGTNKLRVYNGSIWVDLH